MNEEIYDVIGVGFGPSNLAVAVALRESEFDGRCLFLERRNNDGWQEEMMLEGSDIQHHPLRDLVTPVNPRSEFGFLSYLAAHDRLFEFFNLPTSYPLRSEYSQYIRWVAGKFSNWAQHGVEVQKVDVDGKLFVVQSGERRFFSRSLVVAPGRTAFVPPAFADVADRRIFHLTRYSSRIEKLSAASTVPRRVAVVGASQSAVEIVLDLSRRWPHAEVHSICRSYGYQTKDTSPFTHHAFFPSFMDEFYAASSEQKTRLWSELKRTNYSAADQDVLDRLYLQMYEDKVLGRQRVIMKPNRSCTVKATEPDVVLRMDDSLSGASEEIQYDAVVLATGFRNIGVGGMCEPMPPILENIASMLSLTSQGVVDVGRDYQISPKSGAGLPPLYLNGLCEGSHGLGDAGSFSLVSVRAAEIVRALNTQLSQRLATRYAS